jgi:4-amino-4-deoxy-L-arabinose transferase-like glycosyltransferase
MIQWFNQFLFLVLIGLVYFWARRMFDPAVAMTSAILLFGSEVLWRFSSAGLSTMLLLLIFMGVVWCLTIFSSELIDPKRGPMTPLVMTVATGLLLGLGFLTRYGFGWLIIPTVLFYVLSLKGPSRVLLTLFLVLTFAAVTIPWMIRNYGVCGAPFGTAGYSLIQGAGLFPENRLDRSLHPEIQYSIRAVWLKLLINSRLILQNEFFTFAGGWTVALFLVGLLVGFRNLILRRIRYFSVGSLALLFLVQVLGRTQLSEDSPGINTENYLVLLLPIVIVYGVGMFFMLMDQIALPARQLRYAVLAVLVALSCSPFAFALLPPKGGPLAYPPYYPPTIIETAEAFRQSDLLMSDIPWAVAWYGNRQCVWLTLNATHNPKDPTENENFFAINDMLKPINGVYLTPKTMDMHYQSDLIRAGAYSWGNLLLNTMLRGEVPTPFPLREIAPGYLPEQMFLTDWKRWNK